MIEFILGALVAVVACAVFPQIAFGVRGIGEKVRDIFRKGGDGGEE